MKEFKLLLICLVFLFMNSLSADKKSFSLPEPRRKGATSLEEVLNTRRSGRNYSLQKISRRELAQLLWAGNGRIADAVSSATRTAPSAGGLYPVELYVIVFRVSGLAEGVYHYNSRAHSLTLIQSGSFGDELVSAASGQSFVKTSACTIIITSVTKRSSQKYGRRAENRYQYMDAGHAAQNIILQSSTLDLISAPVGAFDESKIQKLIKKNSEEIIYLIPVGKSR